MSDDNGGYNQELNDGFIETPNYIGPERRSVPREEATLDMERHLRFKEGWLVVLSVIAILALFGAVLSFIRDSEQDRQRERDRIVYDLGSCQRGNESRELNKRIALAGAALDREVLDIFFERADPQRVAVINERLAPAFDRYKALVDEIKKLDCEKLVLDPAKD